MRYFLFAATLLLASCASAEPNYYTLLPVKGTVLPGPPIVIEIRRPALPAYLDRPEMIKKTGYVISRDDRQVWAEPLDKMIERILALDVGQRIEGSNVFAESGDLGTGATYKVDVDLQQFEPDQNSHSKLVAQIAIISSSGSIVKSEGPITLYSDSAGTGAAMAGAMSKLLSVLADHIAADIRNLPLPLTPVR